MQQLVESGGTTVLELTKGGSQESGTHTSQTESLMSTVIEHSTDDGDQVRTALRQLSGLGVRRHLDLT